MPQRCENPRLIRGTLFFYNVQETVEEGIMELKHWPGKDNVADIGTKWLNRHDFEKYRAVLINMHAHRRLSIPVP